VISLVKIYLERSVNLGNYEMYKVSVSDDFDNWEDGIRICKLRIEEALKLLGADWQKPKVTVEKVKK